MYKHSHITATKAYINTHITVEADTKTVNAIVVIIKGKIVHTNEFLLLPEDVKVGKDEEVLEGQGTWYSYSEAAEILQQRVDNLDNKLKSLKSKSLSKDNSLNEVYQAYENIKEKKIGNVCINVYT